MNPPTVAVDFDGVLAQFTKWEGPYLCGEPVPGCEAFLATLAQEYRIVVFSNRAPVVVVDWLFKHNLMQYIDDVTQTKPMAQIYIDDKALTFRGDFVQTLADIKVFRPWWKE
jgi:hypothetical protein